MSNKRNRFHAVVLAMVSFAAVAGGAEANPQVIELASGQTAVGSFDPMTTFTFNGGLTWNSARVVAPHARYSSIPGTRWVSCGSTVFHSCGLNKTLTYRTRFLLPEGFTAPELLIDMLADNEGSVLLNGQLIGSGADYSGAPDTYFAVDAGLFRSGINTIEFDVRDWGVASGLDYRVLVSYNAPIAVTVDIHPGSDVNPINLGRNGTTPVAIVSSAEFDAPGRIDAASLRFGSTGDEASLHLRGRAGQPNCAAEDVNGDALADLVCHFHTEAAGFQPDDSTGRLTGMTTDGSSLHGADRVTIVPRR